jgi:hypothetical protein
MTRKVKVYEIEQVRITILKSLPPKLQIVVDATVPTPGYTEPELVEYIYVKPPPDGIYDFDFVAKPPDGGPTASVITPISVRHLMEPMPEGLKGVRIHASNNSMVKLLSESSRASAICVRGKLTDEGVECQALRGMDGQLYTLLGDLNGFKNGDEVIVCGNIAEISFCMQGTTIIVTWIGTEASKAG